MIRFPVQDLCFSHLKRKFNELQNEDWFNENVTSVQIKYTLRGLFPNNISMFSIVNIRIIKHPTGLLLPSAKISTYQTQLHIDGKLLAMRICYTVLTMWITFLLFEMYSTLLEKGVDYFRSYWHILNVLLIITSLTLTTIHIAKEVLGYNFWEAFEGNPWDDEKNITIATNLEWIIVTQQVQRVIKGLLLVLLCLRSFWFMRFFPRTSYIIRVMSNSTKNLLSYMLYLLIFLLWIAYMCKVVFLKDSKHYITYLDSLRSVILSLPRLQIHTNDSSTVSARLSIIASMLFFIGVKVTFIFFVRSIQWKQLGRYKDVTFSAFLKKLWFSFSHVCTSWFKRKKKKQDLMKHVFSEIDYQLEEILYRVNILAEDESYDSDYEATSDYDESLDDEVATIESNVYDASRRGVIGYESTINNTFSTLNNQAVSNYFPRSTYYNNEAFSENDNAFGHCISRKLNVDNVYTHGAVGREKQFQHSIAEGCNVGYFNLKTTSLNDPIPEKEYGKGHPVFETPIFCSNPTPHELKLRKSIEGLLHSHHLKVEKKQRHRILDDKITEEENSEHCNDPTDSPISLPSRVPDSGLESMQSSSGSFASDRGSPIVVHADGRRSAKVIHTDVGIPKEHKFKRENLNISMEGKGEQLFGRPRICYGAVQPDNYNDVQKSIQELLGSKKEVLRRQRNIETKKVVEGSDVDGYAKPEFIEHASSLVRRDWGKNKDVIKSTLVTDNSYSMHSSADSLNNENDCSSGSMGNDSNVSLESIEPAKRCQPFARPSLNLHLNKESMEAIIMRYEIQRLLLNKKTITDEEARRMLIDAKNHSYANK